MTVPLFLVAGCNSVDADKGTKDFPDERDSLNSLMNEMTRLGGTDSLLQVTTSLFYAPHGTVDTMVRICAAVYSAQEFIAIDQIDSAKKYLDYLMDRESLAASVPKLGGIMYMTAAFYELKVTWNLSTSIELFIKSYEHFQQGGDLRSSIISLVNIVQFFYTRSDIQGLEYAEIAYSTAKEIQDDGWYRCVAAMSMAQMLELSDTPEEADPYIHEADSLLSQGGYQSVRYMIQLLHASRYADRKEYDKADSCYAAVMAWLETTGNDPSGVQEVCLQWGKFCQKMGRYADAMRLYGKGIAISDMTGTTVILDKLLLNMSVCAMRAGKEQTSLYYYKRYLTIQDSLSIVKSEQDFNDLYQRYRNAKQDMDIMAKNLEISEARKKIAFVIFLLVIVVIVLTSVLVMARRQRKMYRTLVIQYQNYLKNMEGASAMAEAGEKTKEKAEEKSEEAVSKGDVGLWRKTEYAMKEQQLYRRKDLTLETLAEAVGTNRTYLSKTINTYSGGDFYTYLSKYRVKEAISILRCGQRDLPLKQVADMVGFNSLQIFYKVFSKETGLPPGKYRTELLRMSAVSDSGEQEILQFQHG